MNLQPPLPPPRLSSSCPLHPSRPNSNFCPSCLRDRLSLLHISSSASASLRRSKSFSANSHHPLPPEPHRRSFDVRSRHFASLDDSDPRDSTTSTAPPDDDPAPRDSPDFNAAGGRRMKDHIDSDARAQPPPPAKPPSPASAIAGGFRHAASAVGRKLQKWRRKKKVGGGPGAEIAAGSAGSKAEGSLPMSEAGDYGYGRRSCDTEPPRFSLDLGVGVATARASLDGPRRSLDNPRASWDGYLIGGRAMHRLSAMGSLVEDCPVAMISRSDAKIPVEEPMNSIREDPEVPGGTMQTRDYYLDSSSSQRRRRSFERSRSIRKTAGSVIDDLKSGSNSNSNSGSGSNSKVSPSVTDYLHRNRIPDLKVPNLNSNSLREHRSESFESIYRDVSAPQSNSKKGGWWSKKLSMWGLIHRRGSSGRDDDNENSSEIFYRGSAVERSTSEKWQCEPNGYLKSTLDRKVFRSNSTRTSSNYSAFGSTRNGFETHEKALKRNQSARFTSSILDNNLFQLNSSRRKSSGLWRSGSKNSDSSAKSGLRML